jgi:hypothetical protein
MFAIDHAATALLIKRRYPTVPLTPLLIAVQAMELAWVALNYLGLERTSTEPVVRSVADIHLGFMPYSHSVATGLGAADTDSAWQRGGGPWGWGSYPIWCSMSPPMRTISSCGQGSPDPRSVSGCTPRRRSRRSWWSSVTGSFAGGCIAVAVVCSP